MWESWGKHGIGQELILIHKPLLHWNDLKLFCLIPYINIDWMTGVLCLERDCSWSCTLCVTLCLKMYVSRLCNKCMMIKCPKHSMYDRLNSVECFILCLLQDMYYSSSLHWYILTQRYVSFLSIIRLLWKQATFSSLDGISACATMHPLRRPFTYSLYVKQG